MNKEDLKYTYENDADFRPYPTNVMTICQKGPFAEGNFDVDGIPSFNPMMLLHGEQDVKILKPLKTNTKYVVQDNIADY